MPLHYCQCSPTVIGTIADAMQRVWFLVPTVQLCQQQCQTLQRQIRSVEIRSFSSHDKVDVWTLQVWEATLRNVRVAVATYGVLQNALSAGFVKMDSIALIVFDEGKPSSLSNFVSVGGLPKLTRSSAQLRRQEPRKQNHARLLLARQTRRPCCPSHHGYDSQPNQQSWWNQAQKARGDP